MSFSIKKPKEDPPKEIKSALPIEESSEDETTSTTPPLPPMEDKPPTNNEENATTKNGLLDEDDPILEMIDLTDDVEEKRRGKLIKIK